MHLRIKWLLIVHACSMLLLVDIGRVRAQVAASSQKIAFSALIDHSGYTGSILILDDLSQQWYANDFERCGERFTPASTFKIPNTLIALELGTAQNDDVFQFQWDGQPRWSKSWEKDLSLKEAFRVSCVPCYQSLARKAGLGRMTQYLELLGYPGMQVDSADLDKFWLEGPSAISQFEQIDFLQRFYHRQLPISARTFADMKDIFILEQGDGFILSAKTGLSIRNELTIGWLVGYLEIANNVFFFATNLETSHADQWMEMVPLRLELTKAAFREIGVL